MSTVRLLAVVSFLLWSLGGEASAQVRESVSKAIGGKTMPGYRAVKGKSVKLGRPWRARSSATPADGPALSLQVRGRLIHYLDKSHYQDVREVALDLLRRYPPDQHFYVALGRSPSSLHAFLAELNPNIVMTFPASDLRLGVQPEWKAQFFAHFAELIPDDVLRGERTMVFFDRAHNGSSLALIKGLLEEYLRTAGHTGVTVKAVGIAPQGTVVVPGVDHVSSRPGTFQYFSGVDNDEEFAPFLEKHQIGVEPIEKVKDNQNYWKLRRAMRERMAHDRDLRRVMLTQLKRFLEKS